MSPPKDNVTQFEVMQTWWTSKLFIFPLLPPPNVTDVLLNNQEEYVILLVKLESDSNEVAKQWPGKQNP